MGVRQQPGGYQGKASALLGGEPPGLPDRQFVQTPLRDMDGNVMPTRMSGGGKALRREDNITN